MRSVISCIIGILVAIASFVAESAPLLEVTEILKASDKARSGAESGMTWTVEIESTENGEKFQKTYSVKTKGSSALVETLQPAKNRGEKMLLQERAMWFFKPGLRKPVSISTRQKLSGQAANGDIAATRYSRDYDAQISGEDNLDSKPVLRLLLKAKAKNVTYDQIWYWVDKASKTAVKAEFLTLDGQVLKTALFEYANIIEVQKEKIAFVSKMKIIDRNSPDNQSIITYKDIRIEEHPDRIFNVNNIER